jgi:mannose-6-phosphate isomerase-like protein (cupin superfamily)
VRRLITGTDSDGRSCVIRETEVDRREPAVDVHSLFLTRGNPVASRPAGRGEFRDLDVPPGHVHWLMSYWAPGEEADLHHSDTLDFDVVVEGSMDLILDDGVHRLERKDCVVIAGVDHAWRSGPDGCTLSVLLLGTPPPKRDA